MSAHSPPATSGAGSTRSSARADPEMDYKALFEALPGLYLVLDTRLVIVAVSDAYARATMTTRETLLGRHLFDVFPDNPNDPAADGTRNLRASLQHVLDKCAPDSMPVQRYDIRRPASEGGGFEERYWSPRNVPLPGGDGKVRWIVHRVEDVTEFVQLKQQGLRVSEAHEALRERAQHMEGEIHNRNREVAQVNAQLKEAHQSLRQAAAIVDSSADAIISKGLDGRITSWNKAAERIFGYAASEILGRPMLWLLPEDRQGEEAQILSRISSGQSIGPVRTVRRTKHGALVDVAVTVSPVRDERGLVVGASNISRDVSERVRIEYAAQENEKRLKDLFDNLSSGVAIFQASAGGEAFHCIRFNRAAQRIDRKPASQALGQPLQSLFAEAVGRSLLPTFRQVLATGEPQHLPVCLRHSGQITGWRDHYICRLGNGEIAVIYDDTTGERQEAEKVYHLAHYDALTGLPNRALLADRVRQAVASAQRHKSTIGQMYIDLDRFKEVNDSLGHSVGDLLLGEAARRMLACVRESDTVARIGGDEFVVLLACIESAHNATAVAEKIVHSLRQPFDLEGHQLRVSASIGIALFPDHAGSADELARHADQAMYVAKRAGRDGIALFGH